MLPISRAIEDADADTDVKETNFDATALESWRRAMMLSMLWKDLNDVVVGVSITNMTCTVVASRSAPCSPAQRCSSGRQIRHNDPRHPPRDEGLHLLDFFILKVYQTRGLARDACWQTPDVNARASKFRRFFMCR